MKRSRMRNDCADVAQWIRELWRLMEILEEPGLHVLWRRGRQAGQDPKICRRNKRKRVGCAERNKRTNFKPADASAPFKNRGQSNK